MGMLASWIEMPAKDIERAAKFYGALYDTKFEITEDGPRRVFVLSSDPEITGISLNQTANFEPVQGGVLIYLNFDGKLDETLEKVKAAGGELLTPRIEMGDAGFYVMFNDSEGNTLALWSMS